MRNSGKNSRSLALNASLVNTGEAQEEGVVETGIIENIVTETEAEEFERFSKEMTSKSHIADPVKTLQTIFPTHKAQRRNPGVNRIAEKYKNLARSQNVKLRASRTNATSDDNAPGWNQATGSFESVRESFPITPGSSGTFFSKPNMRQSYPVQKSTGEHILLKHEETNRSKIGAPPATAPAPEKKTKSRFQQQSVADESQENKKEIDDIVSIEPAGASDYKDGQLMGKNRLLGSRNLHASTIAPSTEAAASKKHLVVMHQENGMTKRPSMPMTSHTLYPV